MAVAAGGRMKKYMQALARHEAAKQKVENLTRRIGAAIGRCPVVVKSNDWSLSNAERAEIWDEKKGGTRRTCGRRTQKRPAVKVVMECECLTQTSRRKFFSLQMEVAAIVCAPGA